MEKNRTEYKNNVLKPFLISLGFRRPLFQAVHPAYPEFDEGSLSKG
jgi:hypothetical protein